MRVLLIERRGSDWWYKMEHAAIGVCQTALAIEQQSQPWEEK